MRSVCAIVVTFNRLNKLKHSIFALKSQSIPCDILIVNNNSTDGTYEWLTHEKTDGLYFLNMAENLGGAGGFHYGLKEAIHRGYDYFWLMDDDCIPEINALEELVNAEKELSGNYGWLSSVALWTDGSFCRMNIQRSSPYKDVRFDQNIPLIKAQMASFVSLFINRRTVMEHGVPISEFFIWGDDWEYTRRISINKNCYVVNSSIVVHEMENNSVVNIATDTLTRMNRYSYAYRNDVFIYRREGVKGWLWVIAKDCWHTVNVLFRARGNKCRRIVCIWKGFSAGLSFKPDLRSYQTTSYI